MSKHRLLRPRQHFYGIRVEAVKQMDPGSIGRRIQYEESQNRNQTEGAGLFNQVRAGADDAGNAKLLLEIGQPGFVPSDALHEVNME